MKDHRWLFFAKICHYFFDEYGVDLIRIVLPNIPGSCRLQNDIVTANSYNKLSNKHVHYHT